MERFLVDLRHGARMLRRSPALALLAAIALAIGIGSTTTMYSITSGILRDLPVDAAHRLVHVASIDRQRGEYGRIRAADIVALREQQRSFEGLAAFEDDPMHIADADRRAARFDGATISADAFAILRVQPVLGRAFTDADERPGAEPVVILGQTIWRDRYESDPAILGRSIRVDGVATTVIGVMPEGFRFPESEDVWLPLRLDAEARSTSAASRGAFVVFGRLRDGVSLDAARAEVASIARRLDIASPIPNEPRVFGARAYRDELIPPDARIIFRVMLLVVSFVLVIACANVANLLLARAVQRSREIAVRSALGASRARITTQLLGESFAVSALGGAGGLALAWAGVTVFNGAVGFELDFWMRVGIDRGVLLFATLLVVAATVAAGIAPARQASRVSVSEVLKDEARGSSSFRLGRASRALVVGEVALSSALLVVTGLMVKGIVQTVGGNVGTAPERVLTARFELREDAYPDVASRARFFEALATRLAARPGVRLATVASATPSFSLEQRRIELDGARYAPDDPRPAVRMVEITPGYFETFGTSVLQGRGFAWSDGVDAPRVVIVNRPFVERHIPDGAALGRRLRVLTPDGRGVWATIVGVAPELGMGGIAEPDAPGIYLPLAQHGDRFAYVAIRSDRDPLPLIPALRDVVASMDPDVPLFAESRFDRSLARANGGERVFGGLFAFFGLAALTLALVGLFGVLAFSVSRRTRELGIRIALGGSTRDITWLVARGGVAQLLGGMTIGLALAALLAPMFGDALFGSDPRDWRIYAGVGAVLLASGLAATLVPARRALRVDPIEALRHE